MNSLFRLVWLCSALFLLGCAPAAPAGDRALLIGINNYQSKDIRKLEGSHNDVAVFRSALISQMGFSDPQILELKDADATRQGILGAIENWLIKGSRPGDRVVLYYSGHGHHLKDLDADEKARRPEDDQDETLVVYDSNPTGNQILDDEIATFIKRLQDRKVLAVFDACHSGTLTRGESGDPDPEAKTPGWDDETETARGDTELDLARQMEGNFIEGEYENVAAFFAVAPNQYAVDDRTSEPSRPHSVFTQAFARGLSGAADLTNDGISYSELLDYVRKESKAFCVQYNTLTCQTNNGELTPMLEIPPMKLADNIRQPGHHGSSPPKPAPAALATALFANPGQARLDIVLKSSPPTGGAAHPATTLKVGDLVSYDITSGRPGQLVLFDINAKGEVTQLFPNRYMAGDTHRPEWINAHDPVKIPGHLNFKLRMKPDLGPGKLVAVLIEDDTVKTGQLTAIPSGQKFLTVADPARWLLEFRALLNQLFHAPNGSNRAIQWSMATVDYQVIPKTP